MNINSKLVDLFIRHPRADYHVAQLHVGVPVTHFTIVNSRGHVLHASMFSGPVLPGEELELERIKPYELRQGSVVIIYCHGSAGSRVDGVHDAIQLCSFYGLSLLVFDFEAAGLSDGKYISLGVREESDVAVMVQLCEKLGFEKIALWGRSMGAVASLLYSGGRASEKLSCIVLDSPYCALKEIAEHVVARFDSKLLRGLANSALPRLRKQILQKVPELDIDAVDVSAQVHEAEHPAFFFHAEEDDFVLPAQSLRVFEAYGSEFDYKNKVHRIVEGSHNSTRGPDLYNSLSEFLCQNLIPEIPYKPFIPRHLHEGQWENCDIFVCKRFMLGDEDFKRDEDTDYLADMNNSIDELKEEDEDAQIDEELNHLNSPERRNFSGHTISPWFVLIAIVPLEGLKIMEPYSGVVTEERKFMEFDGFSALPESNLIFYTLRGEDTKHVFWCHRPAELSNEFDLMMKQFVDCKLEEVGPEQVIKNLPKAVEQLVDASLRKRGKVSGYDLYQSMCKTLIEMIGDHISEEEISDLVKQTISDVIIEKTGKKPKFRKPLFKKKKKSRKPQKNGKCIVS